MKTIIRTLDGSFYEVEGSVLQPYMVPKEEVAQQLRSLKSSLQMDVAKEFEAFRKRCDSQQAEAVTAQGNRAAAPEELIVQDEVK